MASLASCIDSMIKEYLVFRGFTSTLKCFQTEIKNDGNKSFKVEKVVEQFSQYIQNYDVMSLKKYWRYFEKAYFCQLGHDTYKLIKKLETNVLRLYVVHALQSNKQDRVVEFFEKYNADLLHEDMWKDWFVIPFMKNPEQNKTFGIYFTRLWKDSVMMSLSNCLDTIFTNISLPTLLNFEKEKQKLEASLEENAHLLQGLSIVQQELHELQQQAHAGKHHVYTQTVYEEFTKQLPQKEESTKKQSSKARFGPWKLLAGSSQKEKDNKKETNSKRLSLDENKISKLNHSSKVLSKVSSEPDDITDFPSKSEQATSEKDSSLNEAGFKKSLSHTGSFRECSSWLTINETVKPTSPYYAVDNPETPFIILSQDEFKEHHSSIVACKFSDHSNLISSLDIEGTLNVWRCYPSVASVSILSLHTDILSVDWLPRTEDKLFLGKSNGHIGVYDICSKKYLWEVSASSQYKRVTSLVCSPSSTTASVCCTATCDNKPTPPTTKNNMLIKMKQYSSHYDQASSSKQGSVTVWDLQTGTQKSSLSFDPFPVCIHCQSYNHNGTLLVTGGADGMIRLFDIRNNDCLVGWHAHTTSIVDVLFDANETSIYSLGADGKLCIWDINKVSSKLAEYPLPLESTGVHHYNLSSDDPPCGRLLCCHSDGAYMMTCGASGMMLYQIQGTSSLEESMHIVCPSSEVTTLDWSSSPNCSTAVCGTKNGALQVSTLLRR